MYQIEYTKPFFKKLKKYSKKFHNLSQDIQELHNKLLENPKIWIPLGDKTYKIRLENNSSNKGKSGWYRVITYVLDSNNKIYLVAIFSKNELENMKISDIKKMIKNL